MGISRAEQSVTIKAAPAACYAAIADFETYPEWQQAVERVDVLGHDPDGRGEIVEVHVDAKLLKVRYRLHYHHEPPGRLWWDFVEGDGVEHVEGEFLLEPLDGGERTRATYRLGIDPGVPVPALIARRLAGGVMRQVVTDLQRRVEAA